MEKMVTRRFSLTYDEVVTKAQSMQPQFAADLIQFTAFNPWFTEAVNTELQSETASALVDFSQSSHTAEIETQTELIAGLLAQSARMYQKLLYYVKDALGNTKAVMDTFGRARYTKARQSEKEMVSLINQAVTAVNLGNYSLLLEAKGMPPTLAAELEGLAGDLATADGIQEMLKKKQLLVTSQRIELFNSIWDKLSRISSAAKIIFAEDVARLAIYQLYDGSSSGGEQPSA
jgi:hypothetical protein